MRLSADIPLVARGVKLSGPKGFVQVDLLVDTGAAITVLSWTVLKLIGYDPAIPFGDDYYAGRNYPF